MTATTKIILTALDHTTVLFQGDELSPETAKVIIGRTIMMPTRMANETAAYTIESVSRDRMTDNITAWVVRAGSGHHARVVGSR